MAKPRIVFRKLGKNKPQHIRCTCAAKDATDFGRWNGTMSFRPANGTISVDPNQSPKEMHNTLVHELLHDALPHYDEGAITWIADHIAGALWELGYRKQEGK